MTTPCLLLRDLDIIKHVFIKDFDFFSDRGVSVSDKGLGNNLFHSDNDKWQVLRKRFTPIFTSAKLKHMLPLLEELADKFITHLEDECMKKSEYDVHLLFQRYTMATISACAFGLEIDTLSDKMDFFVKLHNVITTPSLVDEFDMMFPGVLKKLNLEIFPKEMSQFFKQLVSTVIEQRNGVPSKRNDLMDLILELRQQGEVHGTKRNDDKSQIVVELTDEVIAAQAVVFYIGGYETSASTIAFMLYELAKNQDIQNKVIAEVDEVLKKHEGMVTFETLNDLPYMENAFTETLRLYPIVEPLQRRAQMDYKLPGTDITVKKDQIVLISGLGIHRDEKYYPNPDKFDPERFNDENSCGRHTCAYLPFGVGPRNCIGMRFGKIQSRMSLVKFFAKFRVEPSSKTLPAVRYVPKRFVLTAEGGFHLNIVPRKL
ncbi:unnamed protein product, partial [Iphiclides podalirius]